MGCATAPNEDVAAAAPASGEKRGGEVDLLKKMIKRLESEVSELDELNHKLMRDNSELMKLKYDKALLDNAQESSRFLEVRNKNLEQENKRLGAEVAELEGRVMELEAEYKELLEKHNSLLEYAKSIPNKNNRIDTFLFSPKKSPTTTFAGERHRLGGELTEEEKSKRERNVLRRVKEGSEGKVG